MQRLGWEGQEQVLLMDSPSSTHGLYPDDPGISGPAQS